MNPWHGDLHFDGAPDICQRMRRLFSPVSKLQQKPELSTPKRSRFVLLRDARGRSLVARAWQKWRRSA